MTTEFNKYVRMPFLIEAVQITDENMDELCALVGHEVKKKGDSRFIVINRRIVPNGYRAYAGWWVTKMGDNVRCYPDKIFRDQFTELNDESQAWFGIDEEDNSEAENVVGYIDDVPVVEDNCD